MTKGTYEEVCRALGLSSYAHEEDEAGDHRLRSDDELMLEIVWAIENLKENV